MGGGIACITATRAGLPVRIKDINANGINHALKTSWQTLTSAVDRRRLSAAQRQQQMAFITGGTDYQGFRQCDMVIEAVFEDLALKQKWWRKLKRTAAPIRCLPLTPLLCP